MMLDQVDSDQIRIYLLRPPRLDLDPGRGLLRVELELEPDRPRSMACQMVIPLVDPLDGLARYRISLV
jgi:hypothetical protein